MPLVAVLTLVKELISSLQSTLRKFFVEVGLPQKLYFAFALALDFCVGVVGQGLAVEADAVFQT